MKSVGLTPGERDQILSDLNSTIPDLSNIKLLYTPDTLAFDQREWIGNNHLKDIHTDMVLNAFSGSKSGTLTVSKFLLMTLKLIRLFEICWRATKHSGGCAI
jgi:hypothetical protein